MNEIDQEVRDHLVIKIIPLYVRFGEKVRREWVVAPEANDWGCKLSILERHINPVPAPVQPRQKRDRNARQSHEEMFEG